MTASRTMFGIWSFLVMGASIFTFVWLVSITHNVGKSWALHAVDHSFIMEMDRQCSNGGVVALTHTITGGGHQADYHQAVGAGAVVQNVSCVVDAVESWNKEVADAIEGQTGRANIKFDETPAEGYATYDAEGKGNSFPFASYDDFSKGANTSVITALVFTSIAMILGVANFIVLLVSSSRYIMLEKLFCFCAGFGAVILISSPWIADIVVTTAGDEYAALPVIVALQITLLWVMPGNEVEGVETKGGMSTFM